MVLLHAGLQSDCCRAWVEEEWGEQKVSSFPIHRLSAVRFGQLCLVHSSCEAQGKVTAFMNVVISKLFLQLQAKLFGVRVVPWVMHATVAVLCFVLIMMARIDLYNPYQYV